MIRFLKILLFISVIILILTPALIFGSIYAIVGMMSFLHYLGVPEGVSLYLALGVFLSVGMSIGLWISEYE